jgi:microcystin-dependent protein
VSNFKGSYPTYTQLPPIDGSNVLVSDQAYTLDDGAWWQAIQPAAPPGAVPAWSYIDTLRGTPGPQGPAGIGEIGPQGQIGPPGQMGARGPQGPPGKSSYSYLAHTFTVPPLTGAQTLVYVDDTSWMNPGALLYIPGAGTFTVIGAPPNSYSVYLVNSGDPANSPPGTIISAGTIVGPASQRGPAGAQGEVGPQGPAGPQGVSGTSVYSTLAQAFNLPATGTQAVAFIQNAASFAQGQIVFIAGGDYLSVQSVNTSNNTLNLLNLGYLGTATGTVCPVGANVSGTGPRGPQGATGPQGPQGIQGPIGIAPTGTIFMWPALSPPGGYLLCAGQAVSRTQYAALFSIISTTFGSGDGSTTFNLPNLQSRMPLGASADGITYPLASLGGEPTHTLLSAELAVHAHHLTDPGHIHPDPGHVHAASSPAHAHTIHANHNHGITDQQHSHQYSFPTNNPGLPNAGIPYTLQYGPANFYATYQQTDARYTGINQTQYSDNFAYMDGYAVGISLGTGYTGLQRQTIGITNTDNAGGTSGVTQPHNNMPPYIAINFIIRT